jgi:hypothetical protein
MRWAPKDHPVENLLAAILLLSLLFAASIGEGDKSFEKQKVSVLSQEK